MWTAVRPSSWLSLLPALAVEALLGRHQAPHFLGRRPRLQRAPQAGAKLLLLRCEAEPHGYSSPYRDALVAAIFPLMSGPARTSPMERALGAARAAAERGEVPIGCVIVGPDGAVLAEAGNRTEADRDPTAHAETAGDPRGGAETRLAAAGRLRSLRHPGALPDVRPGDFLCAACGASTGVRRIPRAAASSTVRASSTSRPATIGPSSIPAWARSRRRVTADVLPRTSLAGAAGPADVRPSRS